MKFDMYTQLVEEHRKDLLRQADQYRLIREALASRPPRAHFWTRPIRWLGQLLINIGCILQTTLGKQMQRTSDVPSLTPCEE